jgi:5S rRNA maturation endonuclease (ribonuclease M5)
VTAYERLVDALRDQARDVKDTGHGKAQAQCPAHDDHRASLSIGPRKDGKGVVAHCHAGCSTQDVVSAVGLSMRDLFDDDQMRDVYAPRRDYHYPDGRVVHRKPNKDFPQSGNTKGRALFHADRIGEATTIYVVEGEKDVEAIEAVGGVAVCPPMGAGQKNLDKYDWSPLRGKHVIVVADKDKPGRDHAAQVATLLNGIAESVDIAEAAVGKDAADHIGSDETLDGLVYTEPGPIESAKSPVLADLLLTRSDLLKLPDPEPLIDGVLDQGTVALLYGKWGTLKSFIAYDWAASVATGRAWQGRPTEQRRALYVAAEGAYGYKGRTDAWEAGWRTKIRDGTLDILPRPVNLTNAADVHNLCALIAWNGYGFIVFDTLARCMVGADENSAKDCGEVVDALHRCRDHTPDGRGVVTGVHHTGKDGKTFRGSSVFEAGADTVYSTTSDGAVIILDREKRKDGPQVDVHRLKLDLIEGTESGVIGISRGATNTERGAVLLSHFRSHFDVTGAYATQLFEVADMTKATFYRALSDLVKRGDLINEGTDRRPFYKLATQ